VEKLTRLDTTPFSWPADDVRGIAAPTLIVLGIRTASASTMPSSCSGSSAAG